jgi:LysM repeat protein/D-Tyr-tRNAtyr deacylase
MELRKYELIKQHDQYILVVYLDPQLMEFSSELGSNLKEGKELNVQIKALIKREFPKVRIKAVKVMAGSMLITTMYLSEQAPSASAQTTTTSPSYVTRSDVYTVQPGDSLSVIAKRFNTTTESIKSFNQLTSSTIYIGQRLSIPVSTVLETPPKKEIVKENVGDNITSYTVISGDSLSVIAKRFQTTVDQIRSLNNLSSDVIYVGQTLKIPAVEGIGSSVEQTPPNQMPDSVPELPEETTADQDSIQKSPEETTSYTVVSGDSLSLIAKRFEITVNQIKETNHLTSDTIYVGQTLAIPKKQVENIETNEPIQTSITAYTVVSGDSLSVIAKRFNVTVRAIKSTNNLASDMIYIGQKLNIPVNQVEIPQETIDAEPPSVPSMNLLRSITSQNQTNVVILGSSEPNAIVDIFVTDGSSEKTYQVKANSEGSFEKAIDASLLKDGTITVTATATDEAGNRSTERQITVEKDTHSTAPTFISMEDLNDKKSRAYPIVGKANPGDRVQIVVSDGVHPEITAENIADAQGGFLAYVDLSSLNDGNIRISAKSVDSSGNVSQTAERVIAKDTTVVQPTIDEQSNINYHSAESYEVHGTSEPGVTIRITASDNENSEAHTEVKSSDAGEYHAALDLSDLKDGAIRITAVAIDSFGNISETRKTTIIKDTFSQEPVIDNKGQVTNENAHVYTLFGVAEPGSSIEIHVSDSVNKEVIAKAKANEIGEFRTDMDLRGLNDGQLTVIARATDPPGNLSVNHETTIIKETSIAPPVIESTETINSQTETGYSIFGFAQPHTMVEIVISDGVQEDITITTETNENGEYHVNTDVSTLDDKELTITATQKSKSGIVSEASKTTILKDTNAPAAPISHNNQFINQDNQKNFLVTGIAEEKAQVDISILNANGQKQEVTVNADESGRYQVPVDLSSMNDGDVIFEITQRDQAGNSSPIMKKTLIKDTVRPSAAELKELLSIYSGNVDDYSITGTTEQNSTLDILLTDGLTTISESVTTDANGHFELQINAGQLNDGEIEVSSISTDVAGNKSDPQTIRVTKDTTIPSEVELVPLPYVNSLNMKGYAISGASPEEGAAVQIRISDGETEVTKTAEVTNGDFNANFDLSILKDGPLSLEVTQTDKAGNSGVVQTSNIEKDTLVEKPVVIKNGFSPTSQQYIYTAIGTAEAGAVIEITLIDSQETQLASQTTTADSSGYYVLNVNLDDESVAAAVKASVTQTDGAGNTSERTTVSFSGYTVKEGDSLFAIAKRYHTTVDALMSLNNLTSDVIQPNQVLRLPVNASEVINLGYMYFSNVNEFANTVSKTGHSMNIVAPSYFDINPDGTLKLTYLVDPEFVETMHQQGIRVVPFLSNHWNREVGRALLANKEQAAKQIADAIERYNLDGINVDIENVTDVDRESYTEFVQLLRELVPDTKEVSVAVAANPNGWTSGWHGSYDYTNLAKYADYLMIMSYDESYPGGEAGPVASADWVERSIQYAVDQGVPTEKIVMGVAHYGRYWIEGASYGGFGISNSQIEKLIETYNGTTVFDEVSKSAKAVITIEEGDPVTVVAGTTLSPGTYTIWYENDESIRHKLSLVGKYNIRGVGNWSIGQENPDVWRNYTTSLPTTVPTTEKVITTPEIEDSGQVEQTYMDYRVVSGDNLWTIANRNNTTIRAIKEINGLTSDMLYVGQMLKLPAQNAKEPVPTPPQEEAVTTYTVVSGDSLSVIAKRFNTTVDAIKAANNLTRDTIYVGETLVVSS